MNKDIRTFVLDKQNLILIEILAVIVHFEAVFLPSYYLHKYHGRVSTVICMSYCCPFRQTDILAFQYCSVLAA
jgi:hypothetical protein